MTKTIYQALILAAGDGSRMRPALPPETPKQFLQIGKESIIERLLRQFSNNGVQQIYVTIPHESLTWSAFHLSNKQFKPLLTTKRGKAADFVLGLKQILHANKPACVVMGDCVFDDHEFERFLNCRMNNDNLIVGVRRRGHQPNNAYAIGSVDRLTKTNSYQAWPLAGLYILSPAAIRSAVSKWNGRETSITLLLNQVISAGICGKRQVLRNAYDINTETDYRNCLMRIERRN